MDFLVYEQMYIEARTMKRKPQLDATTPGAVGHEGEPLDFSFLKLQDVKSLEKERPRAGKRIAIEKDDDEEEAKKEAAAANADEKGEADADKGSKVHVIKNTTAPKVNEILQTFSISLTQQKAGGPNRKAEDGTEEAARKKEIEFHRTCLLLNNN